MNLTVMTFQVSDELFMKDYRYHSMGLVKDLQNFLITLTFAII